MYTVRAATSGNPDFGQYAPISDPATIEAPTLDELRALVRGYMAYHQVGGGNWKMPPVYRDGKKIGNMSFNLRIWRGETAVDEPTNHDVIDWHEGKAMDETTMNCPECKEVYAIGLDGCEGSEYLYNLIDNGLDTLVAQGDTSDRLRQWLRSAPAIGDTLDADCDGCEPIKRIS